MTDGPVTFEGGRQTPEPSKEIHVLWITAGLGCDGDTIASVATTDVPGSFME
jgi:hypothetical protein